MTNRISKALNQIASYIDSNDSPDRKVVVSALKSVTADLAHISTEVKTSADLRQWTKGEFDLIEKNLDSFIARLEKFKNTTNEQDEAYSEIDEKIKAFNQIKSRLNDEFSSINVSM